MLLKKYPDYFRFMILTILQRDIVWGDPAENVRRADDVIDSLPETDLIVLPEMFTTGFATLPDGIAESDDSASLRWMTAKAKERDCAIAGSIAVKTDISQLSAARGDAAYVNRFYFVRPDGKVTFYDKHHLFTYGGEHKCYTPGNRRVVVDYRGVRIALFVCYDLRFPVWSRNGIGRHPAPDTYDLALYVASWPKSRIGAWNTLLRARAIENQCYVAGVNRIGRDPACEYCGGSMVADPYGLIMTGCPDNEEGVAHADIDIDGLNAFRKKFPVLEDADDYELMIKR